MDKPFAPMPPRPTTPTKPLPTDAWDAHVHLMAGADEFPLWDGRVENPAQGPDFDAWLQLYQDHLDALGCSAGLIVHSIFYGTDNAVTVEAVRRMGARFKGVGLLPDGASEADLDQFAAWNMVAVRLNYVHGGVLSWDGAKAMAPALAERGMHIQMLAHADRHMLDLAADIRALPCPVVFDHLGWPAEGMTPDSAGFQALCALLADGHAYVKLSAPYRMCNAPYSEMEDCTRALIDANPERCMWGSDWPHVMLNGAQMPQAAEMINAIDRVISDDRVRNAVFAKTAQDLFGV